MDEDVCVALASMASLPCSKVRDKFGRHTCMLLHGACKRIRCLAVAGHACATLSYSRLLRHLPTCATAAHCSSGYRSTWTASSADDDDDGGRTFFIPDARWHVSERAKTFGAARQGQGRRVLAWWCPACHFCSHPRKVKHGDLARPEHGTTQF
jgi:hypothetical protein